MSEDKYLSTDSTVKLLNHSSPIADFKYVSIFIRAEKDFSQVEEVRVIHSLEAWFLLSIWCKSTALIRYAEASLASMISSSGST